MDQHKNLVIDEFSKQAKGIEEGKTGPGKNFHSNVDWILSKVQPLISNKSKVEILEVAAGTSILGRAIAKLSDSVHITALDLTPGMLNKGKEIANSEGISNISFDLGDAEKMSYKNDSFDLQITRWSFHHMQNPSSTISEMARVCKPGGYVISVDVESPDDKETADRMNHYERLRDPSHVRFLTKNQFETAFAASHLNIIHRYELTEERDAEKWMELTQTTEENKKIITKAFHQEINKETKDPTGLRPYISKDSKLSFLHTSVILIGQKT